MTGLEQRGCWQQRPAATASQTADASTPGGRRRGAADTDDGRESWASPGIDFIPVELVGHAALLDAVSTDDASALAAAAAAEPDRPDLTIAAQPEEAWTERTSLFGDPEG